MKGLTPQELFLIKSEMERVASTMDIPISRHKDAGWIIRNAQINNPKSKKLENLIKLAKIVKSHEEGNTTNESQ